MEEQLPLKGDVAKLFAHGVKNLLNAIQEKIKFPELDPTVSATPYFCRMHVNSQIAALRLAVEYYLEPFEIHPRFNLTASIESAASAAFDSISEVPKTSMPTNLFAILERIAHQMSVDALDDLDTITGEATVYTPHDALEEINDSYLSGDFSFVSGVRSSMPLPGRQTYEYFDPPPSLGGWDPIEAAEQLTRELNALLERLG